MKTYRLGIRTINIVDLTPGPGSLCYGRLEIVSPVYRCYTPEPAISLVVTIKPAKLILTVTPYHCRLSTVTESHHKGMKRLGTSTYFYVLKFTPISLALSTRRSLNPTIGPNPGLRKIVSYITQYRLIGPRIAVLAY